MGIICWNDAVARWGTGARGYSIFFETGAFFSKKVQKGDFWKKHAAGGKIVVTLHRETQRPDAPTRYQRHAREGSPKRVNKSINAKN